MDEHEGHDHEVKVMTTKPKEPTIHTKVNAAEDTITCGQVATSEPTRAQRRNHPPERKLTLPV